MRILMACEDFLPALGGAEIHVKNLIENLKSRGHEVVFFTNQPGSDALDNKIKVYRMRWSKRNLGKMLKILWREAGKAQILHAHYCYRLAFFLGLIGLLRRRPRIVTLHGYGILNHPKQRLINRLKHSFYRFCSLKLATFVISTSQDLAGPAYRYVSSDKIAVIPNGYDEKKFNSQVQAPSLLKEQYRGKKIILTVRRLVPKTGIHYLIEALPEVVEQVPSVRYLALGEGGMKPYLEKRIKELGIRDYVELLGKVDNEKIPEYLALAEVVVFPSTAESSSIACAESMAMEKKIVASRVGGLIELLGRDQERGWLVDLVDWQESSYDAPLALSKERYHRLARAILEALSEKDNRRPRMAGRFASENLTWGVIVEKTEQLYRELLST